MNNPRAGKSFSPGDHVTITRFPRRAAVVSDVLEPGPHGIYLVRWADTGALVVRNIPWHELRLLEVPATDEQS